MTDTPPVCIDCARPGQPVKARGLCSACYDRRHKTLTLPPTLRELNGQQPPTRTTHREAVPDNLHPQNWPVRGVCTGRGVDPDLWHSELVRDQHDAKRLCLGCPALNHCITYTLTTEAGMPAHQRHGIHAGMNPKERAARDKGAA